MSDKEPTQAELQKFWERCGLKHKGGTPELTLDNLVKIAMPKIDGVTIDIQKCRSDNPQGDCMVWVQKRGRSGMANNPKPAIALYRAIQEVLK